MASDFSGAFDALRAILVKHGQGLVVQSDTPEGYTLVSRAVGPNKKPLWFGAVMKQKSAVSFHLVPLYFNPVLLSEVPPELLERKHGKTCFNFQRPDGALFAKLDALTARGRAMWQRCGFLEPGLVTQERLDAALRAGGVDPEALARTRAGKLAGRAKARRAKAAGRAKAKARKAPPRGKPRARPTS